MYTCYTQLLLGCTPKTEWAKKQKYIKKLLHSGIMKKIIVILFILLIGLFVIEGCASSSSQSGSQQQNQANPEQQQNSQKSTGNVPQPPALPEWLKMKKLFFPATFTILALFSVFVYAWTTEFSSIKITKGWNLVYGLADPEQLDGQALSKSSIKAIYVFVPITQQYARVFPKSRISKVF